MSLVRRWVGGDEFGKCKPLKIAAKNDGEATKIKAILVAQAEATEKELRGKGIASMRANITQGWV